MKQSAGGQCEHIIPHLAVPYVSKAVYLRKHCVASGTQLFICVDPEITARAFVEARKFKRPAQN